MVPGTTGISGTLPERFWGWTSHQRSGSCRLGQQLVLSAPRGQVLIHTVSDHIANYYTSSQEAEKSQFYKRITLIKNQVRLVRGYTHKSYGRKEKTQ